MDKDTCIRLTGDDGEILELYVLEETRIAGRTYLLAESGSGEEDGECYIFKDVSEEDAEEAILEPVEDPNELDYVFSVFRELLDDVYLED